MTNEFGRAGSPPPQRPVSKIERDQLAVGRPKPNPAPALRPDPATVETVHDRIERLRENRISDIDARLAEIRGKLSGARDQAVHHGRAIGPFRARAADRQRSR